MVSDTRSYHHGDLRSALVEAGLRLARDGGSDALGLRSVTRSVGVTPNAAYRHFADWQALVLAVAAEAQDLAARAMRDRMEEATPPPDPATAPPDPAERALRRLRGVGLGYIHFALAEPGWFDLAILTLSGPTGPRLAPPYQLLLDTLDEAVTAGALTPQRRTDAQWVCWSAVHGFADLATRGPLRRQDRATVDRLAEHVVDSVIGDLRR
ncbi:TetR/AcrR family transcriptional regulator [Streptomyces yaizuensis]|uniref:TetR/AcrR family transcriptional regulator n=1 Tax=Streptomyces yaizuensis TaxID=2989713 RepID=A0ABQ5P848_9ACTN|nr:TetR/AcrR family transcriptional regulator [Streptomyces sp. YSPA8]GLF98761.1 TetR/AcrR family transcriptional regulator [Streptomyces sp. YSPA8]